MEKGKNKLLIWGAGLTAKKFIEYIDLGKNQIINIVDNDIQKRGKTLCGVSIILPKEISETAYDLLIICSIYEVEIIEQCITMGITKYISGLDLSNLIVSYPSLFTRDSLCSFFAEKVQKIDRIERLAKYNLENTWRNIFIETVSGYDWYNVNSISLGRWAIGYNYAYVLARVLNGFRPTYILELGLGQSSNIITSYVTKIKSEKKICYDVVEQDKDWINFFKNENSIPDEMTIYQRDIEKQEDTLGGVLYLYSNFKSIIQNKKYNLISVDGPWGGDNLSRLETYLFIPEILQQDFVIMIDDYERYGEKQMINKLEKKLKTCGIVFHSGMYESVNDVYIIVSENWKFLVSL